MATKQRIRWGDTLDDEDALPPTSIKGPDSNGVKTITEYYRNDKGETFRKVTKVKVVSVEKKTYKVGGTCCTARQALLHGLAACAPLSLPRGRVMDGTATS